MPGTRPLPVNPRARFKRATIFDVARAADVSYSTVSRVVNGHEQIRDATRRRVQEAMQQLGYVAHVSARALASGRTQVVGLLAIEVESSFFMAIIKGVDQQVAASDYDFMLCTTHDRREKEAEYVARLSHGMVDGLLVILPRGLPDYVEMLRADAFPFVLIDYDDEAPGCTVINAANRSGARAAIAHLIELGHRRIGFITGTMNVGSTLERLAGYREAMAAAGIPVADQDVGARRLPGTARLRGRPGAAVTTGAAHGHLRLERCGRLRRAARRPRPGPCVPADVSVIGFDDIPEASYMSPALTTVRQPLREMGRTAVRHLMSILAEPGQSPARIVLPTELIVRGSTASPAAVTARD